MFFFFNDTATTEIYTLSLHDALPISATAAGRHHRRSRGEHDSPDRPHPGGPRRDDRAPLRAHRQHHLRLGEDRSEEHTSELQSRQYLVCRLLLEKKKKTFYNNRKDNS